MQFFRPARGCWPNTAQEAHRLSRIRGAPGVSPCRAPAMRKGCPSRMEIPGTSLQLQRVRSQDMPRCAEWKAHRRRGICCRQAMLLVEALSHVAGGQQPGQRVRIRNADDSAYGITPESSRLAKRLRLDELLQARPGSSSRGICAAGRSQRRFQRSAAQQHTFAPHWGTCYRRTVGHAGRP